MELTVFTELAELFNKYGFRLYMIGGTSRDYLRHAEVEDFDLVSDATPTEIRAFLPEADYTFSHYGTVKYLFHQRKVDIVTLREEMPYKDYRHPSSVVFVKDIRRDYVRRDFTVNALYVDEHFDIHDFCGGQSDLAHHLIRTIGEANLRFQEDPLRMLRALRFAIRLDFAIEEKTAAAIRHNWDLLAFLNPSKVQEEVRKIRSLDPEKVARVLARFAPLPE